MNNLYSGGCIGIHNENKSSIAKSNNTKNIINLDVVFSTPIYLNDDKESNEFQHQLFSINQMVNCYNYLLNPDLADGIYRNALIDSCLIHIRSLLEFFNPKLSTLNKAKSDLKAIKIIDNWEDEYNEILMSYNLETKQLNQKMDILSQSAIHLSGNRANFIKSDNSIILNELFEICCILTLSFNNAMKKHFLDSVLEIKLNNIMNIE